MTYSYDAVGNRRHTVSNYYDPAGAAKTADYWYLYDGMNRIVLSQGVRNATTGKIEVRAAAGSLAAQGTSLAYDAAGNRRTAAFYEGGNQITESYTYDNDNRLKSTHRSGQLTSSRNYDKNGRVTQYTNYSSPGVISDRRVTTYNANGWITSQLNYDAANTLIARVRHDYANSYDSYGNVTYYTVEGLTGTKYTYSYSKTYKKFDSAREDKINGTMAVYYPNGTTTSTGDTTNSYDANGNLVRVVDRLGTNTTRDFVVNTGGQILKKTEANASEYYFYANGAPVGASGGTAADFDYNYTPVTESYPANSPTNYLVNAGDTLQGIALAVYGDAKLWYLIADANGLTSSNLASYVGKTITIPNRISNVHNDYQTFKPYNPGAIVGDTTPTVPTPPPPPSKDGGCGGAVIIIAIVAVVATVVTIGIPMGAWGAGFGSAGIGAAMLGGAVGSIAGQLAGMALGVQDKFSWGAVASAALTSAAMARMGPDWKLTEFAPVNAAINAAARNVVTQGINIVTGQQAEFNWSSVATSALSASLTDRLGKDFDLRKPQGALAHAGVKALTSAVANKAIGGAPMSWSSIAADTVGSFMRSDAFGNLLGNVIAADALSSATRDYLSSGSGSSNSTQDGQTSGGSGNGLTLRNGDGIQVGLQGGGDPITYTSPDYSLDGGGARLATQMGDRFSYTVQSGDTLTGIAQANGRQLGEVLALNHLSNPNAIREGQEIVIPADGVVPSDVSRRLEGGGYQWNARQEAIAANNVIGTDGMRIGPTIERAQAKGIYSGSQVQVAGMAYPDSPSMTAWDGVVRDSPAVAYLKSQSGGLDPVRASSMDMQLVRGVGDTVNPLYALAGGGYHIGQSIGAAINGDLGQAGLLFAVGAIEVRGAKFDAGGAVANSAGDLSQAAIRSRVEANLAESAAARASSNFNMPRVGLPAREWPPFPGSINQVENDFMLLPGTKIDRFGPPQGTFLSPIGTSYSARALKPGTMANDYYVYEVLRPLPVKAGEVRPWFSESGGGMQYRLDAVDGVRRSPSTLTTGDNPYLKEVFKGKYWTYE